MKKIVFAFAVLFSGLISQALASNTSNVISSVNLSEVYLTEGNGTGSTNNYIRRFSTVLRNTGSDITYSDSATDGATFTINRGGIYAINYQDLENASTPWIGITLNDTALTSPSTSVGNTELLCIISTPTSVSANCSATVSLQAGDVIRAHTGISSMNDTSKYVRFSITKVGD